VTIVGGAFSVCGFENKSLALVNKSLDVGKATKKGSALQSLLSWCKAGRDE